MRPIQIPQLTITYYAHTTGIRCDCGGVIEWAEAGYVPGARACRSCLTLFMLRGEGPDRRLEPQAAGPDGIGDMGDGDTTPYRVPEDYLDGWYDPDRTAAPGIAQGVYDVLAGVVPGVRGIQHASITATDGRLLTLEGGMESGYRLIQWHVGHAVRDLESVDGRVAAVKWGIDLELYRWGSDAVIAAGTDLGRQLASEVLAGQRADAHAAEPTGQTVEPHDLTDKQRHHLTPHGWCAADEA